MNAQLATLLERQHDVVTSGQILRLLSRRELDAEVRNGELERIWYGIYARVKPGHEPDDFTLLRGLDLMTGARVPACLGTAAALFGFDTENPKELHVLSPPGSRLRSVDGLAVHRRDGAPLSMVQGRPVTAAAWTAIEVARGLHRPRALATLDAALRSGTCSRTELDRAAAMQSGRRGIVAVRDLLPLADPRAESPMESEARLVMIDGGLPTPELQYELFDGSGRLRRLDFAWPDFRVAAEYDGVDWHSGADALRSDRTRTSSLMDIDWTVVPIVFEDVRRYPVELVTRIDARLRQAQVA